MAYTLQYGQVTPYLGYLAGGAWLALQIAAIAFVDRLGDRPRLRLGARIRAAPAALAGAAPMSCSS